MRSHTIHDTAHFYVVSYGNGLAYVLHRKTPWNFDMSVLFQGDDAETFRISLDAMTSGVPSRTLDAALGVIWEEYAESGVREDQS